MEDSSKIIYIAFSTIFFCICALFLIRSYRTYTTSLATARQSLKEDVAYQQKNIDDGAISYSELVATLFVPLDYDICINGLNIGKGEHDTSQIEGYLIPVRDYKKSYEYDTDGNIQRVIYTPKS